MLGDSMTIKQQVQRAIKLKPEELEKLRLALKEYDSPLKELEYLAYKAEKAKAPRTKTTAEEKINHILRNFFCNQDNKTLYAFITSAYNSISETQK